MRSIWIGQTESQFLKLNKCPFSMTWQSIVWWLPRHKGGGKKEGGKRPADRPKPGKPCIVWLLLNFNLDRGLSGKQNLQMAEILPNSTGFGLIHPGSLTHCAPNLNCDLEKCEFWSINLLIDRGIFVQNGVLLIQIFEWFGEWYQNATWRHSTRFNFRLHQRCPFLSSKKILLEIEMLVQMQLQCHRGNRLSKIGTKHNFYCLCC